MRFWLSIDDIAITGTDDDYSLLAHASPPQCVESPHQWWCIVYPKKYAHGFVVLCFVVVMQSFIMNSHEVFIHIHQGCFAGTGAIVRLPQCQWSKPDGYGKISQCITTTKHSKAITVCIFLGIYCISLCVMSLTDYVYSHLLTKDIHELSLIDVKQFLGGVELGFKIWHHYIKVI